MSFHLDLHIGSPSFLLDTLSASDEHHCKETFWPIYSCNSYETHEDGSKDGKSLVVAIAKCSRSHGPNNLL